MKGEVKSLDQVERMLKNSQSKVIAPVVTFALVKEFERNGTTTFSDNDIRKLYNPDGSLKRPDELDDDYSGAVSSSSFDHAID